MLLRKDSEVTLNGEVFMVGGEASQTVECGVRITSLLLDWLVWQVNHEFHLAVVYLAPVLYGLQRSTEIFYA